MATGIGRQTLQPIRQSGSGTVGSAYIEASVGFAAGSASASATATAVSVVDRQAAIHALEPKIQALSATILNAIAAGAEPAGPHLENPDFPEELFRTLARDEQGQRENARLKQEATSARRWSLAEKALLVLLASAIGAFITCAVSK